MTECKWMVSLDRPLCTCVLVHQDSSSAALLHNKTWLYEVSMDAALHGLGSGVVSATYSTSHNVFRSGVLPYTGPHSLYHHLLRPRINVYLRSFSDLGFESLITYIFLNVPKAPIAQSVTFVEDYTRSAALVTVEIRIREVTDLLHRDLLHQSA
jgi:hypothetical protein